MVTNKFNSYTDNDLRTIVEGLSNDTVKSNITELKELQSELINRRFEPQLIAAISHLIMKQISMGSRAELNANSEDTLSLPSIMESASTVEKSTVVPEETKVHQMNELRPIKASTAKIDQLRPQPISKKEMAEEEEKFPVLRFLVLFYKIIGWLGVLVILGGFTITAIYYMQRDVAMILCGSGLSLVASAIFLLIFSALSENALWKLEVEKLLRKDS